MIFKLYFILAQIIVVIAYLYVLESNWKSDRFEFFTNKLLYSIAIASAIFVGVNYNWDYQLLCNPVGWTYWIITPVAMWIILFPFVIDIKYLKLINSFFCGLSLSVLGYIFLFSGGYYPLMLFFVGLVAVPIYRLSKSVKKDNNSTKYDSMNFYAFVFLMPVYVSFLLLKNIKKLFRFIVILPVVIILVFSVYSTQRINEIEQLNLYQKFDVNNYNQYKETWLDEHYLELYFGLHWKYHTKMAIVDGWRPPFHDPIIGIRRVLNIFRSDEVHYGRFQDLKNKYALLFPNKEVEFSCKCAKNSVWIN